MTELKDIATATRESIIEKYGLYDGDSLGGMCAIASAELFKNLKEEGYTPKLHVHNTFVDGHVFVSVDNEIIDLTASQFGESPVVMGLSVETAAKIKRFWKASRTFNSLESLHLHLKTICWDEDQLFDICTLGT